MLDFQKQAERFGTIVKGGFIKSVDFSKYPFEIIDDNDKTLIVNSVIIYVSFFTDNDSSPRSCSIKIQPNALVF